jgi:hypothetical protein
MAGRILPRRFGVFALLLLSWGWLRHLLLDALTSFRRDTSLELTSLILILSFVLLGLGVPLLEVVFTPPGLEATSLLVVCTSLGLEATLL